MTETSITRRLLMMLLPLLCVGSIVAQQGPAPGEDGHWKFAVVSLRKSAGGPQRNGAPTADGYQMKNLILGYLLSLAYVPQTGDAALYSTGQYVGVPPWLIGDTDRYDMDAKVDEADLASWHDPARQPAMLRSMLRSMLEDRLKLAVHRGSTEAPVYLLTIGKNGPRFKETNPSEVHEGARPMPGGGSLTSERDEEQRTLHYFGINMAQLGRFVLGTSRPILDKTGLTGRYDFTIQRPLAQADADTVDPGPSAVTLAERLGLKMEPAKAQVETLVIDYVERPSPN